MELHDCGRVPVRKLLWSVRFVILWRLPNSGGKLPCISASWRFRYLRFVNLLSSTGIVLLRGLPHIDNFSRLISFPISTGMGPVKEQLPKNKNFTDKSCPMLEGSGPDNCLLPSSFRVRRFVKFPMSIGILPSTPLLLSSKDSKKESCPISAGSVPWRPFVERLSPITWLRKQLTPCQAWQGSFPVQFTSAWSASLITWSASPS